MIHDDGQHAEDLEQADVILTGVSRSSKTPTSIYLANRGIKTANIPIVPNIPTPKELETVSRPLVVGLIASAERIAQGAPLAARINKRLSARLSQGGALTEDEYQDYFSYAESRDHQEGVRAFLAGVDPSFSGD